MVQQKKTKPDTNGLFRYLEIATKFRNQELNVQLFRNAIFTGLHTILFACYAALVSKHNISAVAITVFGIILSVLGYFYYRAATYWVRFWEQRCRDINDMVREKVDLKVDLFAGHQVGKDERHPQ